MSEENIVDEVTSTRNSSGATERSSEIVDENVSTTGAAMKASRRNGTEEETIGAGGRPRRPLKESTAKLIEDLSAEGDEEGDAAGPADTDDEAVEAAPENADGTEGTDEPAETDEVVQWKTKAEKLEEANRRLADENDRFRKTPKAAARSERDAALADAEQAYIDEGSVVAVRKFLAAVIGAKHDDKAVDGELSGLYADLTAKELGVALDTSHQALREAARARLALARDKRERKSEASAAASTESESEYKPAAEALQHIDNRLTTKRESGKSFADDHPMLMALAEHVDGAKPSELLARTIRNEIMIGTLDRNASDDELIQAAAKKLETKYRAIGETYAKAHNLIPKQADTAKAGEKSASAQTASKDQRQSTGAQKLSNATAGKAPASPPKTKQEAPKTEERPKFKSDKAKRDWALRHLS